MENNFPFEIYKGYSIFVDKYCKPDLFYLFNNDKSIECAPSSLQKVKLVIDGWEYPKEFSKKLDDILNE